MDRKRVEENIEIDRYIEAGWQIDSEAERSGIDRDRCGVN